MPYVTPEEMVAIRLSLKVAFWAMMASMPFGVAVAFVLARYHFWGKTFLNVLVHLPLILPPVVTGYALLLLFGRHGPLGSVLADVFGVTIAFRWQGAAVAAAVMGFPLLVRATRLSIEAIDQRLESAAATLGARPSAVFATITLPLAMPGIMAGMILCFGKALGEFGATITFVSSIPGETRTLPAAIYTLLQTPGGDPAALRLIIVSVFISFAALLFSELLARRIMRRMVVA